MTKKNEKEGTLGYYLEMRDEDFEAEMDKFDKWLDKEANK